MSREEEAKNLRLYDNRTVERNIRKGLITRKDHEKFLKTLPDVTEKIAPKDAPAAATAPVTPRPVEYHVTPIIAIPPAPGSAELNMDDDGIDDDEDDDDIEELDDDDIETETNGATTPEEPKT